MSEQKVQVTISGDAGGLLKALSTAGKATEGMAKEMEGALGGVKNLLEHFAAPLTALVGLLGGGAVFKEAVSETALFGDELSKSAQKAGVTVESLSGLAHAAGLSGVAFEDLVGGLGKLAKNMQEAILNPASKAAGAFKALGIETRTSTGAMRSTDEVMQDVAEKFKGMNDGAGKTALAMNLFGKSGATLIPLLNEGREGISELTAEAKRLGVTMTTEQAKAAEKYKDDMERVEAAMKGVQIRIGQGVMPMLTRLAEWFTAQAPAMLEATTNALKLLGDILSNSAVQIAALSLAITWAIEGAIYPALMKAVQGFQTLMLQMALGRMEGIGALTSLASMVNPVLLVTAAVVGLAFGYERLVTSESRAAEAHLKEIERMGASDSQYQRLATRLTELDGIQKSGKSSVEAKKAAEEEEQTVINQLVAMYPNFQKFLYDEAGKRREISEAIKFENKDRVDNAKRVVEEAQAHLANAKALMEERKQRAEIARRSSGGPGTSTSSLQGYLNSSIADSEQAIQVLDQALQKSFERLQKIQQNAADGKTDAPVLLPEKKAKEGPDPYLAFEAQMKAEADIRRQRMALWEKHQADLTEVFGDGLDKQVFEINNKYDEILRRERDFGADETVLQAIELKRTQELEQAKTDAAKKAADERKRIAEEEARAARELLEQTGTAQQGFLDGMQQYLQRQGTTFQQWAQTSKQIFSGVENAFAHGIEGILNGSMTLGQGLKAIWKGIANTIIQALAQMVAKWIVAAIAAKIFGEANSDAAKTEAVAQQESAAATLWNTYAWIPFAGPAIAAGFIALMNASLAANAASAEGIVGAAEGGWFDRPTMTMIGEGKRPELVVPDVAFKDFAANLSANILAQERQAQGYARQASGYASAVRSGEFSGAPVTQHITHIHGHFIDTSERGRRMLGEINTDAGRSFYQEHSAVLRHGAVMGGI